MESVLEPPEMVSDASPMEESTERRSSSLLSPFQTQLLGNQSSFRLWNKTKETERERERWGGWGGLGGGEGEQCRNVFWENTAKMFSDFDRFKRGPYGA